MVSKEDTKDFFLSNGYAVVRNKFKDQILEIKSELIDYLNFFAKKNGLLKEDCKDYDKLAKIVMVPGSKLRTFIYDSIPFLTRVQKLNHHPYLNELLKSFGYKKPVCVDMCNIRIDIKAENEKKFLRGIHQDIRSIKSKKTVTLWMPITKVDESHGSVILYPKTHKYGLIKHIYDPNLLIQDEDLPENLKELEKRKVILDAEPGDIAVIDCFNCHSSKESEVDKVRSVILTTYTDIYEVDLKDNLFFLERDYEAFAKKDQSLNSTLK